MHTRCCYEGPSKPLCCSRGFALHDYVFGFGTENMKIDAFSQAFAIVTLLYVVRFLAVQLAIQRFTSLLVIVGRIARSTDRRIMPEKATPFEVVRHRARHGKPLHPYIIWLKGATRALLQAPAAAAKRTKTHFRPCRATNQTNNQANTANASTTLKLSRKLCLAARTSTAIVAVHSLPPCACSHPLA